MLLLRRHDPRRYDPATWGHCPPCEGSGCCPNCCREGPLSFDEDDDVHCPECQSTRECQECHGKDPVYLGR
jgi:hypothetical protein